MYKCIKNCVKNTTKSSHKCPCRLKLVKLVGDGLIRTTSKCTKFLFISCFSFYTAHTNQHCIQRQEVHNRRIRFHWVFCYWSHWPSHFQPETWRSNRTIRNKIGWWCSSSLKTASCTETQRAYNVCIKSQQDKVTAWTLQDFTKRWNQIGELQHSCVGWDPSVECWSRYWRRGRHNQSEGHDCGVP